MSTKNESNKVIRKVLSIIESYFKKVDTLMEGEELRLKVVDDWLKLDQSLILEVEALEVNEKELAQTPPPSR